ncbi:hypothetical protein BMS3Bbin14_02237 [bacterium BMS3Bbin14]|nr:hypothetical protein BMS3Bbin14_02237 [bacterium BMS3Bbin14]
MRTCWLTKRHSSSCLLFFAGWGMDPEPFRIIPSQDYDLVMVYDYRDLQLPDLDALPADYRHLHLVAWSMGVWAAGLLLAEKREIFTTATAVNGTLTPIDDQCGIDDRTFTGMIDTFSEASQEQFYSAMLSDRAAAERFRAHRPRRRPENVLAELVSLRQAYRQHGPARDIFARKIVGSRDRIFPARNQVRSWGKENCTVIKAPHFPFYGWQSWDHLLAGARTYAPR